MRTNLRRILLIFVVLVVCFVAFLFFNKEKQKQAGLPPIFSIIGEITEITGNGFSVDNEFLVLMASSTIFSSVQNQQVINQEDANKPILSQEAKFSDLKVKDKVVVESDINLRGVDQFTAKSVQILEHEN